MTLPRRLVWPAAFAAAALMVLVSLGVWQLQRKAWKEDLLARLDARTRQAPRPLEFDLVRAAPPRDWEFQLVDVTGTFRHADEVHVWSPRREGSAWTVFTPLEIAGPATRYPRIVIVARGFAPDALKDPAARLPGQVLGQTTLTGRLRAGETPGFSTPAPDEAKNQWHARDIGAMRRRLAGRMVAGPASGDAGEAMATILPAYVELQGEPPPGGWPKPQLSPLNLKNDHLAYALTWFGLAATLAGVFGVFAWRERRPGGA